MKRANHLRTEASGRLAALLDVLGERRRRIILAHVEETRAASLDELTRAVADVERARPTADQRLRLFSDVRSRHVPALLDAELVSYDTGRDVVVPTAMADLLFDHLERTAQTPGGGRYDGS